MNVWVQLASIGIFLALLLVGGVWLIMRKAFNVKIEIYEQTAGGIKVVEKKGKRKETQMGGSRLILQDSLFKKTVLPVPTGDYFFMISSSKYKINFYKDKSGNLKPIPLRWNEDLNPMLVPDDNEMRFWKTVMDKESDDTYANKTWIEKYGAHLTIGILCATALIILIVYGQMYFKAIKEVAQPLTGQMSGLQDTLGKLMGGRVG